MPDMSFYAPSNYTISTTETDKSVIEVSATAPYGWYGPKGDKTATFPVYDPNAAVGFEIKFDTTMYFDTFGILVNFDGVDPGWSGGGVRVWIYNSDETTGLPTTLKADLGILAVPASSSQPFPFLADLVQDSCSLLLDANKKYWVISSGGLDGEGYQFGFGPKIFTVKESASSLVQNYPMSDTNLAIQPQNDALFFGNISDVGGINASTTPDDNPVMYTDLQPTTNAICVLFKGSID